jgi:hypothetical protein
VKNEMANAYLQARALRAAACAATRLRSALSLMRPLPHRHARRSSSRHAARACAAGAAASRAGAQR